MYSNNGRVLSVVLTIEDSEKASWLWDAMDKEINGVQFSHISNEDLHEKVEVLSDGLRYITWRALPEANGMNKIFQRSTSPKSVAEKVLEYADDLCEKYKYDTVLNTYPKVSHEY